MGATREERIRACIARSLAEGARRMMLEADGVTQGPKQRTRNRPFTIEDTGVPRLPGGAEGGEMTARCLAQEGNYVNR